MEEWRPLPGYEGTYEVSSAGRLRSLARNGTPGGLMTPCAGTGGYMFVTLRCRGIKRTGKMHVLVASAFIGPRPDGQHVRHMNGDPSDNRADNLAYGTRVENEADKDRHGRRPKGADTNRTALTPDTVRQIRAQCQHTPYRKVAAQFGLPAPTVHHIKAGRTWAHV